MDDYSIRTLTESRNEWCNRLLNIFTPAVVEGLTSVFNEAVNLCNENDEDEQYLMTFQSFLGRIPKWNNDIITTERKRIEDTSGCTYLEDLITCVHIVHLKSLTCIQVGNEQKKVNLPIPNKDDFVHKIYIDVARAVYSNVYLFESDIPPLQIQKNKRELEIIIRECIMNVIRDNIPAEDILKAYMEEALEEDVKVTETILEKKIPKPVTSVEAKSKQDTVNTELQDKSKLVENKQESNIGSKPTIIEKAVEPVKALEPVKAVKALEPVKAVKALEPVKSISNLSNLSIDKELLPNNIIKSANASPINNKEFLKKSPTVENISFTDIDNTIDDSGKRESIIVPKDIDTLEKISEERNIQRKLEEEEEDDDFKIKIGEEVKLDLTDINDLNRDLNIKSSPVLEVETLM